MAAALASRVSRGRSLLGGLSNAFSGLMNSSNGMMNGNILSQQQQRTFIQMGTILKAVDNSGAKEVMCIQSLKGKKGARLGDIIVGSVKEAIPKGKVKKGKVVYCVVRRAAMQKGRVDGSQVRFDDNAVVIVGIKEKNKKNSDGSKKKMEYNQLVPECLVLSRMRCGTENSSRSLLWLSTSFESIHQTKTPVMISLCDPDPSIT